jgi:benzodiazapine receptor
VKAPSFPARRPPEGRTALLAAAPVLAAFLLGNVATFPNLPWYETLAKPAFNPPNWLFGPVWTVLYVMMAVALYRVLALSPDHAGRRVAFAAFLVQIALNGGWSWAFFAAHSPAAGLATILALLAGILATLVLFWRLDRFAGALLVPYLGWVIFAAALNAAILMLNRGA